MSTSKIQGISSLSYGIEKMSAGAFYRLVHNWKDGDVSSTKFKPFPPKESLPLGSCLHLLDNFKNLEQGKNISDIPNLNIPFVVNENLRKLFYSQRSPQVEGWKSSPVDYIFRTAQLQRNLESFASANSGKFIIKRNILDLAPSSPSLSIINHNPVFRLFVRGTIPTWRNTEHFLTSILNTISLLPNKTHYVVIPLSPKIHVKSKFNQISNRVTSGAIADKHSYQYCLLAQLYNFINVNCNLKTPFDSIPNDKLKDIVLVFEIDNQYLFWSLDSLKTLNVRNKIFTRIFNHFNGFILKSIANANLADDKVASKIIDTPDMESNTEKAIAEVYSDLTKTPLKEVIDENSSNEKEISKNDEEEINSIIRRVDGFIPKLGANPTELTASDVTDIVYKEDDVIEEDTHPETDTVVSESIVSDMSDIVPVYTEKTIDDVNLAIVPSTPITTSDEAVRVSKEYLKTIDEAAISFIDKDVTLTTAQKERAKKMATSYKQVTIDGKTIEEIIATPIDPSMADVSDIDILKNDPTIPPSMIKSSVSGMDSVYMTKMHTRHIAAIASSMASQGMYLQSVDKSILNTELTQTEEYTFKYKSVSGKQHNVKFSMPIIRPDGTFLINGVRSTMSKQLTTKPIAKISPTRVSLASNYNKTIIEKQNSSAHNFATHFTAVMNYIVDQNPKAITNIEYGVRNIDSSKICGYEYAAIASKYNSFVVHHANQPAISTFYFDGTTVKHSVPNHLQKAVGNKKLIWIGKKEGKADYSPAEYYMDTGNIVHMVGDFNGHPFHFKISMLDFIQEATNIKHKKMFTEWTDIKILDAKFPIGFILAYRFGLLRTLRMLGAKYKIINTRAKRDTTKESKTDIIIPFANSQALLIPRYPLKVSLILQGLTMFNTRKGAMEDFEHKDIYYQLLLDKNLGSGRTNYLIGIDDTFDMFIDPMTYERLVQMGEPTSFEKLLIRATEMLVTHAHQEAASMSNHYVRSYERMNSILYNEMTSQMRTYKKQRGNNNVYSINPYAVLQRILQDQTVMMVEDLNPIHDIKTVTKLTYLGMGGRTSESFVEKDRKFPKDAIGILSESTPSAGNVGIVTQSSMDPTIVNMYGIIDTSKEAKDLDATKFLSVAGMLSPAVTMDDAKRAAFNANQLSHVMPVNGQSVFRVRTGYEKLIAHRCSDLYSVTAEQDGVVTDVNEKLQLIKIQYKDGSTRSLSYSALYGECSDMVTEQQQVVTVKKGDKFKKHEVLRYNPQFFELDQDIPRQVNYKLGVSARVAFTESSITFEDSSVITTNMSNKLHISPIEVRTVVLPRNIIVHSHSNLGDHVNVHDTLLTFELNDDADITGILNDDAALDYLEKLNRNSPRAKHKGEIVDIKVLYACEYEEIPESVRKMISKYTSNKNAISKYVKDSVNKYMFHGDSKVPVGSKYRGVSIDDNTIVLQYYIKETLGAGAGDKIVIDSSLKTVLCKVIEDAPVTEDGKEVDVIFSMSSISNRIINSPFIVGISEAIMIKLEENVLEEYFK